MNKINSLPSDYRKLLQSVKRQIQESRIRAYRTVNNELIQLYWNIGEEIATRQERDGWGKSVVERLSKDLCEEFTGTSGFRHATFGICGAFMITIRKTQICDSLSQKFHGDITFLFLVN